MPDRIARVWNGTSWEVITSTAAASNAVVVYQSASPSGPVTGQVWVDSDDRQFYIWNGSSWISAITTFNYQSASPSGPVTGQIWVDSDDLKFYVWSGSSWVSAITSSNYQSASPSSPTTGQIWINSTTDVMSVWNGTSWIPTKIDASNISSGTLAVARGGTGVTTSTGTGNVVLSSSPTLTTPNIGAATGTSIFVSGSFNSGANGKGGLSSKAYLQGASIANAVSHLTLDTLSSAQGERSGMSFYSTFQSTADNGSRRTADILAGFNGGAWGTEYLAFNVGLGGAANDGQSLTTERLRISKDSILSTVPFIAPAATTSITSIRIPHGTAPTSPTNGDIWTTTQGIYARINGVTSGPLVSGEDDQNILANQVFR